MLIIFGGLPGSGKTTIAKALATRLEAVYLRIDTIEQALVQEGIKMEQIEAKGYVVAYALAAENLQLGSTVVADAVNPINLTREAWRDVASKTGVSLLEVEVICSDKLEHRRRVETRMADIAGHRLPAWNEIIAREQEYEPWANEHLIIDTAKLSALEAVDKICQALTSR